MKVLSPKLKRSSQPLTNLRLTYCTFSFGRRCKCCIKPNHGWPSSPGSTSLIKRESRTETPVWSASVNLPEKTLRHTDFSDLTLIKLESLTINADKYYILNRLAILRLSQAQKPLKLRKFLVSHSVVCLVDFFVPVCLQLHFRCSLCSSELVVHKVERSTRCVPLRGWSKG